MAQGPLRLQLLHQPLERHVLVRVRVQRGLPHPPQQLAEAGSPARSARSTSVLTKKPISASISAARAPGDRGCPPPRPRCRAYCGQQHLEGGQQHHEQRGALAAAPAPAAARAAPRRARTDSRAPRYVCTAGRGRSVGSSSSAGAPASCSLPVRQLPAPAPRPRSYRAARPRSRRTAPAAPAAATRAPRGTPRTAPQLADEHAHGPAVADDVVHRTAAARGPRRPAAAAPRAKSGPAARSNGRRASSPARRADLRLALLVGQRRQVLHRQREAGDGAITCTGCRPLGEDRAQRLVPPDDLAQRALQRRRVQRARQAQRDGDVVDRAPRLQLVQEPEPLLRERERQRARRARPGRAAAAPAAPRGAAPPPRSASSATVGASKSARSGSSTPNTSRIRDDHPRGQQRVPAQLEEVVVAPPPAPRPAPPPRSPPAPPPSACAAPRTASAAAADSGAGSALRSSLPFGVSGSASSTTNAAGTMYSGSAPAQVRAQRVRASARAHHVRHQPLLARHVLARHDDAPRARPGASAQRRLDLAQLDAEAADLHLLVEAAQVLQRPVRQPPRPVARAVQPRAGSARTGPGRSAPPSAPGGPGSRAPRRAPPTYSSPGTPDRHAAAAPRPARTAAGRGSRRPMGLPEPPHTSSRRQRPVA